MENVNKAIQIFNRLTDVSRVHAIEKTPISCHIYYTKACGWDCTEFNDKPEKEPYIIPNLAVENSDAYIRYMEHKGYYQTTLDNIENSTKELNGAIKSVEALEKAYESSKGTQILKLLRSKEKFRDTTASYLERAQNNADLYGRRMKEWKDLCDSNNLGSYYDNEEE